MVGENSLHSLSFGGKQPDMHKHVSLCILAYKRLDLLAKCLDSIEKTADYPYTLIVNVDGGDPDCAGYLSTVWSYDKISNLILSGGNNRGVGRSFQNCLGVAEGDYIIKIDADVEFIKPNWLSTTVRILDTQTDVGAVGLFDYSLWDPHDERFTTQNNVIEERENCRIVHDFVSSVYAFRGKDRSIVEPVEDDGNHTKFNKLGTKLALTKETMVINEAFGVGKSTYVSGTMDHPYKTPTFNEPLIFKKDLAL